MNAPTEEIKFGDASPVIRDNRDKIVFDEFEYDTTSLRRTGQLLVHHQNCRMCIHYMSTIYEYRLVLYIYIADP